MNISRFIKEIELFLPHNKAELMREILDQRTWKDEVKNDSFIKNPLPISLFTPTFHKTVNRQKYSWFGL
jgi:hypothetical protein